MAALSPVKRAFRVSFGRLEDFGSLHGSGVTVRSDLSVDSPSDTTFSDQACVLAGLELLGSEREEGISLGSEGVEGISLGSEGVSSIWEIFFKVEEIFLREKMR